MNKYRNDLDGLRAIAVISVLLFHYKFKYFSGGFVGVDIFIVLSGFLITSMIKKDLEDNYFSFSSFYAKRIRRIFPAFLFQIILTALAVVFIFSYSDIKDFMKSATYSLLSVSNYLFWSQVGYFDKAAELKPLIHHWSLSVEEQFYFILPILLFWQYKDKNISRLIRLILRMSIVSFLITLYWIEKNPASVFYLLPFRFFEFGIGTLLALQKNDSLSSKIRSEIFYFIGLVLIGVSIFFFNDQKIIPSYWSLIPCVGTAFLIQEKNSAFFKSLLSTNPLGWIGRSSFSIYLFHWPIYVLAQYYYSRTWNENHRNICILASFLLGFISFRFIEQPFRKNPKLLRWFDTKNVFLAWTFLTFFSIFMFNNVTESTISWRGHDKQLMKKPVFGGEDCNKLPCIINGQRPAINREVIVIGDSHAAVLMKGLESAFPTTKFLIYQAPSCNFASLNSINVLTPEKMISAQPCRKARLAAFEMIKKSQRPVILVQSWVQYNFESLDQKTKFEFRTNEEFYEYMSNEIIHLKTELKINKLIVIGNVPTTGNLTTVWDCLNRPGGFSDDCGKYPRQSINYMQNFNLYIKETLKGKALVIDPFDFFCNSTDCFAILNDQVLYSDDHHLSELGSILYVESISRSFEEFWR